LIKDGISRLFIKLDAIALIVTGDEALHVHFKNQVKLAIMNKAAKLHQLLRRSTLDFLMEAHNGISAKIVEEAGFPCIWGSGLTISASMGVRDSNEASWTQVLEVLEFMSDATHIPILLDGDTGYGNFNNMRRLIRKLEQRDIAGVCIEDKLFPKTNSFIAGETQALADLDEFCGKIKAGKDSQGDDNFCIVARVEALIAGLGMAEALKRAEAYRQAGADAILIHSKRKDVYEIECFAKEWGGRHPLVIVPTTYCHTPTEVFRKLGISTVIWANHLLRSAIGTMQASAECVHREESISSLDTHIVPLQEVFRLQGDEELRSAEKRYLPQSNHSTRAIILAASRGELKELTETRPKTLIEIAGQPILHRMVELLRYKHITNIHVVRGYGKELVKGSFECIDNDEHENTTDLYSLHLAQAQIREHCLVLYGDSMFRPHLIDMARQSKAEIALIVDSDLSRKSLRRDLVICDQAYVHEFQYHEVYLQHCFTSTVKEDTHGEWTGILALRGQGCELFRHTLETWAKRDDFRDRDLVEFIDELAKSQKIQVLYTRGGWIGIDDYIGLEQASNFYA